jgi:hypothetical protein
MSLEKIMKEWIKHGLKEVIVGAVRGTEDGLEWHFLPFSSPYHEI